MFSEVAFFEFKLNQVYIHTCIDYFRCIKQATNSLLYKLKPQLLQIAGVFRYNEYYCNSDRTLVAKHPVTLSVPAECLKSILIVSSNRDQEQLLPGQIKMKDEPNEERRIELQ